jgi:hypothetical protein
VRGFAVGNFSSGDEDSEHISEANGDLRGGRQARPPLPELLSSAVGGARLATENATPLQDRQGCRHQIVIEISPQSPASL